MKNLLKYILNKLHILEFSKFLYTLIRGINPSVIYHELRYRISGAPDGLRLPSNRLIFLVIGNAWGSVFYDSGKLLMDSIKNNLIKNNIEINKFDTILDFGCGCGRLIRHLSSLKGTKLYGTDYNYKLINWCKENLKFAEFDTNNLTPPLKYNDDKFDFIYARSVFTHLGEKLQHNWMSELKRILKKGGILYFTTHGDQFINKLNEPQMKQYKTGDIVTLNDNLNGQNICGSFQSKKYVEENLMEGFDLINFIPGVEEEHLKQDVYILKKDFKKD